MKSQSFQNTATHRYIDFETIDGGKVTLLKFMGKYYVNHKPPHMQAWHMVLSICDTQVNLLRPEAKSAIRYQALPAKLDAYGTYCEPPRSIYLAETAENVQNILALGGFNIRMRRSPLQHGIRLSQQFFEEAGYWRRLAIDRVNSHLASLEKLPDLLKALGKGPKSP